MLPAFDDNGYLPPGIHPASLDEIAERFGTSSEMRRAQMESLRWLVDLVKRAGILRLVINGSFVTDVLEPNDVDCALLVGDDYPRDSQADEELEAGLPFLQLEIVKPMDFEFFISTFYAKDRHDIPKGMVEVVL